MAIKSKNIRYSLGFKISAGIIVWLSLMCIVGSSFFLLYYQDNLSTHDYSETSQFQEKFSQLVRDVVELNVIIVEDTKHSSGRLNEIQDQLSSAKDFMYYIYNVDTGEINTNVKTATPLETIKKLTTVTHYSGVTSYSDPYSDPYHNPYTYQYDIELLLLNTPYEIYAAVELPPIHGDYFYNQWYTYMTIKQTYVPMIITVLIFSTVFLIFNTFYLFNVVGRKEKKGSITLLSIDRLYNDIHTLLVIAVTIISLLIIDSMSHSFRYNGNQLTFIGTSILIGIPLLIGINYTLSMVRQIKAKQLIKNTLLYRVTQILKRLFVMCFSGKAFMPSLLLLLLAYGAIDSILFAFSMSGDISTFLIVGFVFGLFNLAVLYFVAKALVSLSQIMKASKVISSGNLDYQLNLMQISPAFMNFATDIKTIQSGLKMAVEEAVKGERMKTALITNVSHDLKTPLTSIITYVDLLKNEAIDHPKASEYIEILIEKSARMKHLIEDLVEASKATSGNLEVHSESIDLYQLVQQAIGEFEENIQLSQLDFRILHDENTSVVEVDGKHMWRIVENLLSNVVKYAQPTTRVYIEIKREAALQLLTIKNISAYALNLSPEQLTERFVRGDTSRTTEGSGLGLSIAQSLTALMGGNLKIEIDGDLFKVNLSFPII